MIQKKVRTPFQAFSQSFNDLFLVRCPQERIKGTLYPLLVPMIFSTERNCRSFTFCGNKCLRIRISNFTEQFSRILVFLIRYLYSFYMREKTSRWLLEFYHYVNRNPSIIFNGWRKYGITAALENGVPSDDHFYRPNSSYVPRCL